MKSTELRLGNLVKLGVVNDPYVILSIDVDGCLIEPINKKEESDGEYLTNIEPIPLTEEWLLKFGFNPSDEGYRLNNYMLQDFKFEYSLYEWDSYNNVEVCIKNNIEYVHQLQNLYFALTGDELTLKS